MGEQDTMDIDAVPVIEHALEQKYNDAELLIENLPDKAMLEFSAIVAYGKFSKSPHSWTGRIRRYSGHD